MESQRFSFEEFQRFSFEESQRFSFEESQRFSFLEMRKTMSKLQIQTYRTEVEKIIQYGGSRKETTIRVAFQRLLENYCDSKNFILIPELDYRTKHNTTVYPDGTIKDALRLPWGYWESKDQDDNLDKEIQTKLAKGYPNDNILFEDSQTAVLIQGGTEVMRVSMADANKLDKLLTHFLNYERPEVRDFRQAIEHFKQDLPTIVKTLRQTLNIQAYQKTCPLFFPTQSRASMKAFPNRVWEREKVICPIAIIIRKRVPYFFEAKS